MATILDAADGGAQKTKIMYSAYISYAQLKDYLSVLVENGLLEYQPNEHKYKTTEKGMKFQRLYHHIDDLTGPLLEQTNQARLD